MDVLSFLHKIVVYRHFSYFQYGFQNGLQRSCDYFYYYGSNESFTYMQHSVKVSQQYIEWFWRYSVLNPYTLNIRESLKHAWH